MKCAFRSNTVRLLFVSIFLSGSVHRSEALEINRDHLIGGGVALTAAAVGGGLSLVLAKIAINRFFAPKLPSEDPFTCMKPSSEGLADVVGQDELVLQVSRFVTAVKNHDACEKIGAKHLKGMVLVGQPRMGKTLLAHSIAAELGAHIIEITKDDFEGDMPLPFLGPPKSSKKKLETLFSFAEGLAVRDEEGDVKDDSTESSSPEDETRIDKVVIFFNGVEKIFSSPDLATHFFKQVEKLENRNVVVVGEVADIGALNLNEGLAGDFSREKLSSLGMEYIPLFIPNLDGRKALMAHFLENVALDDELPVDEVVEKWAKTFAWSSIGSLKDFVGNAALVAAQSESETVKPEHFAEAFFKHLAGVTRDPTKEDDSWYKVAIHEAGHVITRVLSGSEVLCASIVPREMYEGVAIYDLKFYDDSLAYHDGDFEKWCVSAIGGFCAEKLMYNHVTAGPVGDLFFFNDHISRMVGSFGMGRGDLEAAMIDFTRSEKMKEKFDEEALDVRKRCLYAAKTLLEQNKDMLEELATALFEKKTMYKEEIYAITGEPRDEVTPLLAR